jgi:hypothetical protein
VAKAKNYAITYLTEPNAVILEVDTESGPMQFRLSQYSATFACNEIPQASCLVAVGRDFRRLAEELSLDTMAPIHQFAPLLEQMLPARVYGNIRGEMLPSTEKYPDGKDWDPIQAILFSGYLVGHSRRKINGKIQPVLHLIHKTVDLTHSSLLSSRIHPQSTQSLLTPACFLATTGAGAQRPATLGDLVARQSLVGFIETDMWAGIKDFLVALTKDRTIDVGGMSICADPTQLTYTDVRSNVRAKEALEIMEGPTYVYGVPIKMRTFGLQSIPDCVSDAICALSFAAVEQTTYWDFLVSKFLPEFSLVFIPLADRALIVPDTPALNQTWRAEIRPDDYDEISSDSNMGLPLRQVVVYGSARFSTNSDMPSVPVASGQYTADQVSASDGMIMSVGAPKWLEKLTIIKDVTTTTANIKDQKAISSSAAGAPKSSDIVGPVKDVLDNMCYAFTAYAHTLLVANTLKSRSCTISGKLRFDIGPGSLVKISPKGELFLDGLDSSETVMYAHVARVTVNINAEGPIANTIFQLTHVRTENENDPVDSPRTCVDRHPLYKGAADGHEDFLGAPLVPDLDTE